MKFKQIVRTGMLETCEFQKGFQPIPNLVKDEKGDLLADFQSILNRWKYHL